MMKNFSLTLFSLFALAFISGCASITRGTTDTLIVNTTPTGALVRLSNGMSQVSPATFVLPRKTSIVVSIEKEGYESASVTVVPQTDSAGGAGMAGNVLLGGLVGIAVDASTGASKSLVPNPVVVNLVKKTSLEKSLDQTNTGNETKDRTPQSKAIPPVSESTIIGTWCNPFESGPLGPSRAIEITMSTAGEMQMTGYVLGSNTMFRKISEEGDGLYSDGQFKYRIVPATGSLQLLGGGGLLNSLSRIDNRMSPCESSGEKDDGKTRNRKSPNRRS